MADEPKVMTMTKTHTKTKTNTKTMTKTKTKTITKTNTFREHLKERSQRLVTFETFDQSDEGT